MICPLCPSGHSPLDLLPLCTTPENYPPPPLAQPRTNGPPRLTDTFWRHAALFFFFFRACLPFLWYTLVTMPRYARVNVPNAAHHVYQRSINDQAVFTSEKDRRVYLQLLRKNAHQYNLDILAYCLLRDCVHLVVIPRQHDSLAKAVGRTHYGYAQYYNQRRGFEGRLWRNRFQSCPLDDRYKRAAVKFVELQPLYRRLVREPEKYRWSSAACRYNGQDPYDLLNKKLWPASVTPQKWRTFLKTKLDEEIRDKIRMYTQTGRPLGTAHFVANLEKKFHRRLHPMPVGRPPHKN